jgi:hypothetical protein
MGRAVSTPKGALLTALGLLLFAPQIVATFVMPRLSSPEILVGVRRFGTLGMLAYCLMILLTSVGERAIYFSPAEVNFLFSGPFTRRGLLAYKVGGQILSCLIIAVFMTAVTAKNAAFTTAAFVGLTLALVFLQLFSVAVSLIGNMVGALAYNRGRRLALVALAAIVAAGLAQVGHDLLLLEPLAILARVEQSSVVQFALSPLRWFVEAFAAERLWPDLVKWTALAFAVDAAMLVLIFSLDAQYLEAAAASSAKIYAKIEQMRRGGLAATTLSSKPGQKRFSFPSFPRMGGAGPIAWRQLTTAQRDFARVLAALLVIGSMLIPLFIIPSQAHESSKGVSILAGVIVSMTIFLTALVPFDFRADFERMAELKALPISSLSLSIGQILTPLLLLTLMQWLTLGVLAAKFGAVEGLLWGIAAFALPYNAFLLAIENLWMLLYPARPLVSGTFDIQAMGRLMIMVFVKVVALAIAMIIASGVALLILMIPGDHWIVALAVAWLILAGFAASILPLIAWAFRKLDVSTLEL